MQVRNQFGRAALRVRRPETLCLPGAGVVPAGANPSLVLGHFRCHNVNPVATARPAKLVDRFKATKMRVAPSCGSAIPCARAIRMPPRSLAAIIVGAAGPAQLRSDRRIDRSVDHAPRVITFDSKATGAIWRSESDEGFVWRADPSHYGETARRRDEWSPLHGDRVRVGSAIGAYAPHSH